MATRFNSGDSKGVPSGYQTNDLDEKFQVPTCGIEDVDRAIFNLFDEQLGLSVHNSKSGETKKSPVIFASGERWAFLKNKFPIRDKNQTIVLPLITIKRTGMVQDIGKDITGRGINQQTGELIVKRKLSKRDRTYQNLISKLGLKNQENLSTATVGKVNTKRKKAINSEDLSTKSGGLMLQNLEKNVWEVFTIPSPQFYQANYEITFWTQYLTHMNQMIQQMMSSYLMQGHMAFRIETTQGYWFVAQVNGEYAAQDNSEDYGEEERIVKYTFNMSVPAYYITGNTSEGIQHSTRRYVSAPIVDFGFDQDMLINTNKKTDQNIVLASDPTSEDFVRLEKGKKSSIKSNYVKDVIKTPLGKKEKYVKIVSKNASTGETVYREIDNLHIEILDDK